MQTSGAMRREIANSYSVVIAREGGRSSIPETAVIESIRRGVLDPPPSRGMTATEEVALPSIQHPPVVGAVQRERRHVDLESLAAGADHLVAPGHEARRGRQRHAAG